MSDSLKGKVAIVTGSGQGVGKGIAIYLARQGVKVITNNRKPGSGFLSKYNKEDMPESDWNEMVELAGDAETTATLIREDGGEATACFGDITDWNTAEKIVKFAVDTYGSIDILVNNAGGTGAGTIDTCTEDSYESQIRPKTKGTFNMMRHAVPYMIEQGSGRVLNASSEAWLGLVGQDAYSTANAGVVGLTWASSKELWRHGITVNVYCPQGASPAHAVEYNAMLRKIKDMTGQDPDPNLLKVVERNHGDAVGIGPVIAFLASDKAAHISGAVFSVYASGVVKLFSDPAPIAEISLGEEECLWTLEDLDIAFRKQLMGEDYVCSASISQWG
jgi:3-oxoacyl-[acyl-carrier protein] reductase